MLWKRMSNKFGLYDLQHGRKFSVSQLTSWKIEIPKK